MHIYTVLSYWEEIRDMAQPLLDPDTINDPSLEQLIDYSAVNVFFVPSFNEFTSNMFFKLSWVMVKFAIFTCYSLEFCTDPYKILSGRRGGEVVKRFHLIARMFLD